MGEKRGKIVILKRGRDKCGREKRWKKSIKAL
jgi:hypothetical protein